MTQGPSGGGGVRVPRWWRRASVSRSGMESTDKQTVLIELVPRVRLRGKQTLATSKSKMRAPVRHSGDPIIGRLYNELDTKSRQVVVLQREIVKLVDKSDMQSKSILVLQRANEKLQGESDMHRKSILEMHRTNEMQTKSILALHRTNDNTLNASSRRAAQTTRESAQATREYRRNEPERDFTLERLAGHLMHTLPREYNNRSRVTNGPHDHAAPSPQHGTRPSGGGGVIKHAKKL